MRQLGIRLETVCDREPLKNLKRLRAFDQSVHSPNVPIGSLADLFLDITSTAAFEREAVVQKTSS